VTCSFYSAHYDGRLTAASGQTFYDSALTAASKTLPFGTKLKLTNPKNGHSVIVRVNDRCPFVQGRDISVTREAARRLQIMGTGVAQVEMENLSGTAPVKK
jgi:rare lipoprotein A